jgi:hypothetical protein
LFEAEESPDFFANSIRRGFQKKDGNFDVSNSP